MTLLEKALNTIKNLRGQNVEVFGQPYPIDDNNIEYNDLVIDVLEVFKNLKKYEITEYEDYNPETDEYEEIEFNNSYDFIIHMEDLYRIEETRCDNSYNWGSPVSNDFYFNEYYNSELDEYYYVVGIHKYGDVRGNYTDEVLIKFDGEWELQEKFYENEYAYKVVEVEVNGKKYDVNVNLWSDEKEVYDEDGSFVCSTYENDEESIIEDLKEKIQ